MKKILTILPVVGLMTLGACSSTANSTLVNIIDNVQTAAVIACKFEPTAATIAAILTANSSATAAQVAALICGAVNGTTPTPTRGAGPMFVTVNGQTVPVKGNFVH